jgi:hypothetical protein
LENALDAPVSIEFKDSHLSEVCEFIVQYVGINIVLDYRFIEPTKRELPVAAADTAGATEVTAPEYEPAANYVTDGMVPYIKVYDVPLKDALQALLAPLELSYEVHPAFILITAKTHLGKDDFSDPAPSGKELNAALDSPISIEFQDEHISGISDFIAEYMGINIVVDKRAVQAPLQQTSPTMLQPGAAAQAPGGLPGVPAHRQPRPPTPPYLVKIGDRVVNTGYVKHIKMDDVPAREAFKALLVPLGLYYKLGPGFVFISTPELLETTDFAPPKQEEKSEAKAEAESSTQPFKVAGFFTDSATSEQSVFLQFHSGLTKKYKVGEKFEEYEVTKIDSANQSVVVRSEKDGHEYTASSEKPGREDAKPGGERLLYDKLQGPVMTYKPSTNPTLIAPTLEDE